MEDKRDLGSELLENELREHLSSSLYPETADDLDAVERAIMLCVCGRGNVPLTVAGRTSAAGMVVAVLDLEGFVERRITAWMN